ncbi:hypothetical protein B0H19DRAFT_1150928 [Mycena capillaripes]|nr:hypothetical protein B0H19DRAFT_1150928 [Mycena capillaripes]
MTSGAKKEKARKKAKAQKLLEEQQHRVEEEKARQTPVSTPTPLITPAAPIAAPLGPVIDDVSIHGTHDSDTPGQLAFPPVHPAAPLGQYDAALGLHSVYDNCRSPPLPPPRDLSWYQDDDNVNPICTVFTIPSTPAPRDFSALRSTASTHPWRTIRRRIHRLLPQRRESRPFPQALTKRTVISAPRANVLALQDDIVVVPIPIPAITIPVATVPIPVPSPGEPRHPFYLQRDPPACVLPSETAYGTAQSALAVACAREFPWVYLALGRISEIAWGPHPDERQGYLLHLPCDQLIFLAALTEMMSLQPDLAIFFEKPMANLANAWVDHCDFG